MSNLGPQRQKASYAGLLQVPGGITSTLQTVQDGNGNATGLQLSTTSVSALGIVSNTAQNVYGGSAGQLVYQTGVSTTGFVSTGTTGQFLQSNGLATPTFVSVTASTVGALPTTGGAMTGAIDMNANLISDLATPVASTDAATKGYVDSVAVGLQTKTAVTCASTADIPTLSGLLTIDGITVTAGQRVLVKDQSTQANNGIYVAAAGAWSRSTDADTWAELVGAAVFVSSGTANAGSTWVTNIPSSGTIGVTAIVWNQFSATGNYTAGTGLALAGNQFSLITPVSIANGGTNSTATPTAGAVAYGTGSAIAYSNVGSAGQILKSNGSSAPTFSTITAADVSALGTSATITNSGTAYTGAVSRAVTDMLGDTLNVRDFGATGNGSTNDGPAIQAAINAASSAQKPLVFDGGTYLLLTAIEIKSNTTIYGSSGAIIFVDKNCTGTAIIGGADRAVYTLGSTQNISINGITFKSTKTGLTKSLSVCFQTVTNLNINECQFVDFGNGSYYAQGFILYGGSNVSLTNNVFDNCSGDGAAFSDGTTNFEFRGNVCSNNGDWGFAVSNNCSKGTISDNLFISNTSTATGADESTNLVFSGNVSYACEHGVRVARFGSTSDPQQYITITNNVINGCQFGVSVEDMGAAAYYTIVGNTITFATQQGIRVSNSENGTIVGNQITSTTNEAILFYSSGGAACGRATVTGNHIHVCTYGIRQVNSGGTAVQITVSGNDVTNASVKKASLSTPGGLGCYVSVVTGSRILGNTYYNDNDFPMFVCVTASNPVLGGNDTLAVYVNGAFIMGQQSIGYGGAYAANTCVSFMVPPGGASYRVVGFNSQLNTTPVLWTEYTS